MKSFISQFHIPIYFKKMLEAFQSVLPIALVVFVIYFASNIPNFNYANDNDVYGFGYSLLFFLLYAFLAAFGLGLFSIGVEQSLDKMGSSIASSLTKTKSILFIIGITFVIGFLITFAEPDLKILASEVGIDEWILIICVSFGVGIFLILGILRILFQWDLRVVFLGCYATILILANLTPKIFIGIAFDAGGVTTGPVTIPFILAFGTGFATTLQGSKSGSDDFGLVAHATMGPIVAIVLLSMFIPLFNPNFELSYSEDVTSISETFTSYGKYFLSAASQMSLAIGSLILFFIIYDLFILKMNKKEILKLIIGTLFCYVGLIFFMSAVTAGFKPVALTIGKGLGNSSGFPIAIIIAGVFGLFAVLAEPAVTVLVNKIITVSEGSIKKSSFLIIMSISIAFAVILSVIRAYYQFSLLYFLIPGYLFVFLLSFLVPRMYSSIAFDAGTVASGPMAASFTMPFVLGFASSIYENSSNYSTLIYENAFGTVAMISLLPIIVVETVGLYVSMKSQILYRKARKRIVYENDDQIIHFPDSEAVWKK